MKYILITPYVGRSRFYEAKRALENWSGEGIPRILTEDEIRELPDEEEDEEEQE